MIDPAIKFEARAAELCKRLKEDNNAFSIISIIVFV